MAAMGEDLERLKQRIPLLEYLQRHHWTGHRADARSEFVGLCPLHEEAHPSFYVNPRKNLFYCHGCGRGGDLIRLVELSQHLSFRQSVRLLAGGTRTHFPTARTRLWFLSTRTAPLSRRHSLPGAAWIARSRPDRGTRHWLCARRKPVPSSQRPRLFPGTSLTSRLDRPAGSRCLLPPGDLSLPPAPSHRQPLRPQCGRRLSPSTAATLQRWLVRLGFGPPLSPTDFGRRTIRFGGVVAGRLSQYHLCHRYSFDSRTTGSAVREP